MLLLNSLIKRFCIRMMCQCWKFKPHIQIHLQIHFLLNVEQSQAAHYMKLGVPKAILLLILSLLHPLEKLQQSKMNIVDTLMLCAFNAKIHMDLLLNEIIGLSSRLQIVGLCLLFQFQTKSMILKEIQPPLILYSIQKPF
jgi:hypothetical protein